MRTRLGGLIGRLRTGAGNLVNRLRGRTASARSGGRSSGS